MENDLFQRHVFDNAEGELGSAIAFDITELFASRLSSNKRNLAFSVSFDGFARKSTSSDDESN